MPLPVPDVPVDEGGLGGALQVMPADGTGVVRVGAALADVVVDQPADAFGVLRDAFSPRFTAAWLVLSAILVLISVQLVAPTRRWHIRRPGREPPAPRSEA